LSYEPIPQGNLRVPYRPTLPKWFLAFLITCCRFFFIIVVQTEQYLFLVI